MNLLPRIIASRIGLLAGLALGMLSLTGQQSRSATFPLDGAPTNLVTITNIPANTTLSFTLDLAPPAGDVFGSLAFSIKLFNNVIIGPVSFFGIPSIADSRDYGTLISEGLDLYDQTLWQVDLGAAAIPSLTIIFDNSFAFRDSVGPLNATLTITGVDIPVGETPLPGAVTLFGTGLGALGLLTWRRNRKPKAAAV